MTLVQPDDGGLGGEVDGAPVAPGDHGPARRLGHVEVGTEVDVDRRLPAEPPRTSTATNSARVRAPGLPGEAEAGEEFLDAGAGDFDAAGSHLFQKGVAVRA